jgi:hypothetical protein
MRRNVHAPQRLFVAVLQIFLFFHKVRLMKRPAKGKATAVGAVTPNKVPPRDDRLHKTVSMIAESGWFRLQGRIAAYKPLPEEHPFYTLIGRVASEWAHLEHILDTTIWGLLGASQELTACVTSQIMGVGPRCKAIETLCCAHELEESVKQPFRKLMSDSYDLSEGRNRAVHDFWVVEAEPDKARQFRAMAYKDKRFGLVEVSKTEIEELLKNIKTFQERASKLGRVALDALEASVKKLV